MFFGMNENFHESLIYPDGGVNHRSRMAVSCHLSNFEDTPDVGITFLF